MSEINCIDVTDFRFRSFSKINLFSEWTNYTCPLQLVTCASKLGLIITGTPNGILVFKTSDLLEHEASCPRRTIPLDGITHVSVNCDDTLLLVAFTRNNTSQAYILKIETLLTDQNVVPYAQIVLGTQTGQMLADISWNPALPGFVCCCLSDGTLVMFEVKGQGSINIINSLANADARCVSWSPRGKQLVAGSRQGVLTQYNPDLKLMKSHPLPGSLSGPAEVLAVCWLSSFQFAVVYKLGSADENRLSLCIVDAPKQGPVTCVDYDDVCYSSGELRPHQFYLLVQHTWNILLCASANAMEVGMLGMCEGQSQPPRWQQWVTEDSARAELPLDNSIETFPIGMALDTSSTKPLPWGEETVPPMPILAVLSNRGVLVLFHVMNLKPQVNQLCSAPQILPNAQPALFTVPISSTPTRTPVAAVQQPKEQPPQQFVQPQPKIQPIIPTPIQPVATQAQAVSQPSIVQPREQPLQPPVQPAVQPAIQRQPPATVPVQHQQPVLTKSTPEAAPKPEEAAVDLPMETFLSLMKGIISIFNEEVSGGVNRFLEVIQKPYQACDTDDSFEELRQLALKYNRELEADDSEKSNTLQPLDMHVARVAEDITSEVNMRTLPGFARLLRSRPLDAATTSQVKEMEQRILYISSEIQQVAEAMANLDLPRDKNDKFGLTPKMAINRSKVYQLKILQFLEEKCQRMYQEAKDDPYIMLDTNIGFPDMQSMWEALNNIPVIRKAQLKPLPHNSEDIISELSDDDFIPQAEVVSPVFSPSKLVSAKPKLSTQVSDEVASFSAWRQPELNMPVTPVTKVAPAPQFMLQTPPFSSPISKIDGAELKTFTAKPVQANVPKPLGFSFAAKPTTIQKPITVRQELEPGFELVSSDDKTSETSSSDQDDIVGSSDLASLSNLTQKTNPSFGLSSFMVGQVTGKPDSSKPSIFGGTVPPIKPSEPVKTTSPLFGSTAVFSTPSFGTTTMKPPDLTTTSIFGGSPASFATVKPSTSTIIPTKTTKEPSTSIFGGAPSKTTSGFSFGPTQSTSSTFGSSFFGTPKSTIGTTSPTTSSTQSMSSIFSVPTKNTSTKDTASTGTPEATTPTSVSTPVLSEASTTSWFSPVATNTSTPTSSTSPSISVPSMSQDKSITPPTTVSTDTKLKTPLATPTKGTTAGTIPITTSAAAPFDLSKPPPTTESNTATKPLFGGGTSLFGTASTSAASILGTDKPLTTVFGSSTVAKPIVFGSTTTTAAAIPAILGSSTTADTPSLFGSVTTSAAAVSTTAVTTATAATPPVFGSPTTTAAATPTVFGSTTTTTATPTISGSATATAATPTAFGSTTTTTAATPPVFGSTTTTSAAAVPLFVSTTTDVPPTTPVFGTTTTTAGATTPAFGSTTTTAAITTAATTTATDTAPVFGSTTTATTPVFGSATSTAAVTSLPTITTTESAITTAVTTPSGFGSTTSSSVTTPLFGSVPTTSTIFGNVSSPAASTPLFGTVTSAPTPVFGSATATDQSTPSKSVFGGTPSTPTVFGNATPGTSNVFGNTTTAGFGPFAQTPTTTASSAFATNVFGQVATPPADSTSQVSNMFGGMMGSGGSMFSGGFSKPASSIFGGGQTATSPTDNSQNLFGNAQACSPFENKSEVSKNLFGAPPSQQNPFSKASVSSIFGQSPGGTSFGSGQTFGQATSPGPFSQGAASGAGPFSQTSASGGNLFGGSSFGTTSPGGFGAPAAFGGSPIFGGAPAFGSGTRPTLFGATSPGGSIFGGGAQPTPTIQESSTFTALANQNTVTFGNLAQQTGQTGFGSFGGGFQQQQQTQAPSANNNQSGTSFGGQSFSSWR